MQEFMIRPDAFAKIRKRTIIGIAIFISVVLIINLVVFLPAEDISDVYPMFIYLIIFGALMSFSIFRTLQRQKLFLESYRVTIEDNVITRYQYNTEELSIYFHEIKEVYKSKNGNILIRGFDRTDVMLISRNIERLDEIEQLLNDLKPISPKSAAPFLQKFIPWLSVLGLIFMIISFGSFNNIVVGITAALSVFFMSWNIYEVRISKNVDAGTKKRIWISLVSILFVIIFALTKIFSFY